MYAAVSADGDLRLTHDGPVVLGGTITFKADVIDSEGKTPSGSFIYTWKDNALEQHVYKVLNLHEKIIVQDDCYRVMMAHHDSCRLNI